MHACLTSKMTSRHTHVTFMTCLFRAVDHRASVQPVMSLLEYFLQKPAISYSYSSFTPVTFARDVHTESQSTVLGRRRICCVYFVPSFACIRLYH